MPPLRFIVTWMVLHRPVECTLRAAVGVMNQPRCRTFDCDRIDERPRRQRRGHARVDGVAHEFAGMQVLHPCEI